MENQHQNDQSVDKAQLRINQSTFSNPLLQTMNSCPYYLVEEASDNPNEKDTKQIKFSQVYKQQTQSQSNPYHIAQPVPQQPQRPVFQNTPEIQIKQKTKNGNIKNHKKQTQQQQKRSQEYIALDKNGNGDYHRLGENKVNRQMDCWEKNFCDPVCVECCVCCLFEVCVNVVFGLLK